MNFEKYFKDKKAIIIGASSGIGSQIAKDLAEYGVFLFLVSRNKKRLESSYRKIDNKLIISSDISDCNECKRVANIISENTKFIDYLVFSAGMFKVTSIENTNEHDWNQLFDINLKSPFFVIQNILPLLQKGNGKSIVLISSILAHFGGFQTSLYSSSKSGVSSMIKSLCLELAKDNIRINSVSPGHVDTPLISDLIKNEENKKEIIEKYPLGRIGSVKDISPFVLFLLSDLCSWITGADFIIDGGRSATV